MQAQTIRPIKYWTFDSKDNLLDKISSAKFTVSNNEFSQQNSLSKVGKGVNLLNSASLASTGRLTNTIKDQFAIEFLFKGNEFLWLTYSQQHFLVRFKYSSITFRTTSVVNNKNVVDNFVIELNGSGKKSYNYYTDDQWHHFVFIANAKTGNKEVWIDGECLDGFSKKIPKANFKLGENSGFRNTNEIDELAIYNAAPSAAIIKQHYKDILDGMNYTFQVNNASSTRNIVSNSFTNSLGQVNGLTSTNVDIMEFAPGYPNYNVQLFDQLKSFPEPRFNAAFRLNRNMSWMDISYLHRELSSNGGAGFGKINPAKAVELSEEMAKRWNYYVEVPILRNTEQALNREYSNPVSLSGALVKFANENKQYPVAAILIQVLNRPSDAGFKPSKSFVNSQDLNNKYYLKDIASKPIIFNKSKVLSPLTSIELAEWDGKTSNFYLRTLLQHLKSGLALINENGEYFGHIIPETVLKQDPQIYEDFNQSKLTASQYSGKFLNRLDSAYKAEVLKGIDKNTALSFYNLSAIQSDYWPDYSMRRKLNTWHNNGVYSTPDFYPRYPRNWLNNIGSFNGYGIIAEGRKKEIDLGDKNFSPFVAAGWGKEEENIRPAQWLALLKSQVMLGAAFFYVGYFNITNSNGKWMNGAGPNDPRGYAYQVVMPSYAQAVRTWVPEFFDSNSELLNPRTSNAATDQFRFKGKGANELIMVRKSGRKYLIYGSIQPISNVKGNVPHSKETEINLEGKLVRFEIRRQGSLYVLNLEGDEPVFYQIDGWHQYEYPSYWEKATSIEAELFATSGKKEIKYKTFNAIKPFDFTKTYTGVEVISSGAVFYNSINVNPGTYKVQLRMIPTAGKSSARFIVKIGEVKKELNWNGKDELVTWSPMIISNRNEAGTISIEVLEGKILLDKVQIEKIK